MKIINCLIIEDEPLAADLLAEYIEEIEFLHLVATCHKAMDAFVYLKENNIDLIFLDLHLPGLKGFEFLKTLINQPRVIVTTAYHQYALEGYEMNVVDFLVKPIEFQRFVKAVNKITVNKTSEESPEKKTLYFTENRVKVAVVSTHIDFIESQGDYLIIHLMDKNIRTKMTLHSCMELLPENEFMRVHKSFIVNNRKIEKLDSSSVIINKVKLPIGRSFKEAIRQRFPID